MEILNVGRSEVENKADIALENEQRKADTRSDADTFFWAAGLAALGSGLLLVRLEVFVEIGAIDLVRFYGVRPGPIYPLTVYGLALLWVGAMVGLGFAARSGQRWAFWFGLVLYAADMITLVMTFSIGAFGVHAFFLYRWFRGQKALKELTEAN